MNYVEIKDEVAGSRYRFKKMDALTQFHVSRRLGPLLASYGVSMATLMGAIKGDMTDQAHKAIYAPIVEVMASMRDEDCNYVIFSCLAVVERHQVDDRWAPVSAGLGKLMFEDMELPTMIRLVVEVCKDNLGPFTLELLAGLVPVQSSAEPPAESSTPT